jgi:predicted RNA methylase
MEKHGKKYIAPIRRSVKTLLDCGNDFALMKGAVDEMYQVFSKITNISIHNLSNDNDIILHSGKAIGSAGAAHCLLEMKRTAVFLRGINKAISKKLQRKRIETLSILYAGTGPYGTLIVPLLLLYNNTGLRVDLLDINPESLKAIQKVIEALDIAQYIGKIYCTDATNIKIERQYDIVVSETMQTCLKNEPQVAIMQNLIPQLSHKSVFIPEEISIDAYLVSPILEQEYLFYYEGERPPLNRVFLGNVFVVNKNNLNTDQLQRIIEIPYKTSDFHLLRLFTTVKIFDNEILNNRDSSITLPVDFYDLNRQQANRIDFRYIQGPRPGIKSRIMDDKYLKKTVNF